MRQITPEVKTAIMLARFHSASPGNLHPTFMSYQRLANILGVTKNQVAHVCCKYFAKLQPVPKT